MNKTHTIVAAIVTHDIIMWYNHEIKKKNVKSRRNEKAREIMSFFDKRQV